MPPGGEPKVKNLLNKAEKFARSVLGREKQPSRYGPTNPPPSLENYKLVDTRTGTAGVGANNTAAGIYSSIQSGDGRFIEVADASGTTRIYQRTEK